ncbi:MAG: hypothetical protein ABIE94_04910 [archaeon]
MINKKGVEMALSTVITIVILLLVVIVVVIMIVRSTNQYGDGTKCISEGGYCTNTNTQCEPVNNPEAQTSCHPEKCCKIISLGT